MRNPELRKLGILLMAAFIDMVGYAMVFPLLPFYAVRLGGGAQAVGWLVAAFSIAQVAASPLWGRFSDRWGRRPGLLIGLAGSAVAFLFFGFATSLWLLFLSRLVQGASGGMTGVMQAYVADIVPPEGRAEALGWLSAATSAGMRAGVLGRLVRAFGEVRMIRLGAVLLMIGFASYPLPERFSVMIVVMALVPIGTALLFPSTTALLSRRGDKEQLGQLMGVQHAFGGASRIVGPLWTGAAFQYVSPAAPFYAAAGIVGLAAILSSRLQPERRR